MTLDDVGELELIRRLRVYMDGSGPLPPGEDDAAAWSEPDGSWMVATCDASIEGVHFDLAWQRPEDAGWRALALALGDLAAKGARPAYGLVSFAAPGRWQVADVEGFYRGMAELATEVDLKLVGGDTAATPGPAVVNLALVGRTALQPRPRSDARAGWSLAVTGPLGGAAMALLNRRSFRLRPRLAEGERLAAGGLVCGDISDGLHQELVKFGLGAAIDVTALPLADGVDWRTAIASGEEAELVAAGPVELIKEAGLRPVGELRDEPGLLYLTPDGPVAIEVAGYEHFRR